MDITKEMVSLMVGIVFIIGVISFLMSSYTFTSGGISNDKYGAAEDIGRLVDQCCAKHAGSYKTYNDDCNLVEVNIDDGNVTGEMIGLHVRESCSFELEENITGKGKVKITYLGRERKVRLRMLK